MGVPASWVDGACHRAWLDPSRLSQREIAGKRGGVCGEEPATGGVKTKQIT